MKLDELRKRLCESESKPSDPQAVDPLALRNFAVRAFVCTLCGESVTGDANSIATLMHVCEKCLRMGSTEGFFK